MRRSDQDRFELVVRVWRSDTGAYQNRFQTLFRSLLRVKTNHLDWLGEHIQW